MKRILTVLMMLSLFLSVSLAQAEEMQNPLRVKLTIGEAVLYATLEDNSASRSLLAQLPLSLSFSDYNGTEKIAYPDEVLDVSDAPDSCDPDVGTLAYYQPWGNLCIFYRDFRASNGLTPLGKIEGDLTALTGQTGDFTVLLENASEATQKPLVAYFSHSGNTATLAGYVAMQTGSDLFEIVPEVPYPDDFDETVAIFHQERDTGAQPAVASYVDNMADYDIVFVGYPIWGGDIPPVAQTFLRQYDWTGKTVIPFCTYGGSGLSGSVDTLKALCSGATILDGFAINGADVDQYGESVTTWLEEVSNETGIVFEVE